MQKDYWLKQGTKPLFPDLLWSRPENKKLAGKLLIVGGDAHGFAAAGTAHAEAVKAGIGTTRVLLPDSLQKAVGKLFPEAEFAPSTPSGSFGRQALAELLAAAMWADGVLLAGDLGRNSETAILLESFAAKYSGQLTITQNAADYFVKSPGVLLGRPETLLVISFAQLQKIATMSQFPTAFTFDMSLLKLVDTLHAFTGQHAAHIIVKHLENMLVAVNGQVSSTKLATDREIWRVAAAARAATWWLQNPAQPFQALTTSVL